MKKILLSIVLILIMFFGGMRSLQCKNHMKFSDFDKLTTIKTKECDVNVFMKTNNDNVSFLIKTSELVEYYFILYDIYGRVLISKEIKNDSKINRNLLKGIYLIRLIDDKETCIKRIEV